MFCGKCGAKNADNVEFCTSCGAKLNKVQPAHTATVPASGQDAKNRKVGMIAVAVVAVAAILLGMFLFGGRSADATIKKFVDAQFDGNVKAMMNLIPDKMIDYALEEEGYDDDDLKDFINDASDELEDQLDTLDSYLGEGWKVSYEITESEDVEDDSLKYLKESYEEMDIKVSAAKSMKVELTIESKESEVSNSLYIDLIKVGRSWYLDIMSMGGLF